MLVYHVRDKWFEDADAAFKIDTPLKGDGTLFAVCGV
jgi:hypothetical protein